MMAQPRRSVVEEAIDDIRLRIRRGEWGLGDRIPPEPELGRELGLSRAPLREALRALVHAGLLVTRQGDGTFVAAVNESEIALRRGLQGADPHEAIEVRRSLDIPAAALAAQRRDDDDLARLEDALDRRRAAAAARDDVAFRDADIDFHRAIVLASHNQLLAGIYGSLASSAEGGWTSRAGLNRAAAVVHDNHDDLYEAIRDQQAQEAMLRAGAILDNQTSDLTQSPVEQAPA
ncbi:MULTISPECIES: FCD domain-containing protein [Arthrobacter]|uniref:FCD domain-containing protein n=2 Tax=Arthrobacter TaxID=1663 RepID=A0ABU9KN06_9MICC|nr:FCD domain-containing protein [Arthrobacter sp. YJM1]MDP5228062.1 FCD domain-containing protein [Arthrobacter sp. YJM1]